MKRPVAKDLKDLSGGNAKKVFFRLTPPRDPSTLRILWDGEQKTSEKQAKKAKKCEGSKAMQSKLLFSVNIKLYQGPKVRRICEGSIATIRRSFADPSQEKGEKRA